MAIHHFNNAVLLIDKPPGITSNDVLAQVRKITEQKKIGHAGTLDKFATGLLIVGTGAATKILKYIIGSSKQYEAMIRLGVLTDTLDPEGSIVEVKAVPELCEERIALIQKNFLGSIKQIPPVYSAVKIRGKRASDLTRRGIKVEIKEREIEIKDLVIKKSEEKPSHLYMKVHCSRGTYIRALARDVAQSLGTVGHLVCLRRTKVGHFNVTEAISLEELREYCNGVSSVQKNWLLTPYESLQGLGIMRLTDSGLHKAVNGSFFSPSEIQNVIPGMADLFMILDENKKLVAIVKCNFGKWSLRYLDVFPDPI
ncbi:MAG: tRNA pseudouridine(55) synthase TruB [Spirochaetes bacterium]|nr:tRNA pseudouridine(55) synthase TruB [Spirochaetota bacterium]